MRLSRLVIWLASAAAVGCGGPEVKDTPEGQPAAPATRLELKLKTDGNINPDAANRPSPVLLRIYELRDDTRFKAADFFALYQKDQETLAGDVLRKQELMLAPGQIKDVGFETETDSRYLAILAAFHHLDAAQWGAVTPIPRARTTVMDIRISGTNVSVSPRDAPETQQPPADADQEP